MPPLPTQLSRAVYNRDDWHCRHCNRNCNLTPHHVTYQSADKSLVYEMSNLLTLCMKCHDDVHERRLAIHVVERRHNDLVVRFEKLKGWKP